MKQRFKRVFTNEPKRAPTHPLPNRPQLERVKLAALDIEDTHAKLPVRPPCCLLLDRVAVELRTTIAMHVVLVTNALVTRFGEVHRRQ